MGCLDEDSIVSVRAAIIRSDMNYLSSSGGGSRLVWTDRRTPSNAVVATWHVRGVVSYCLYIIWVSDRPCTISPSSVLSHCHIGISIGKLRRLINKNKKYLQSENIYMKIKISIFMVPRQRDCTNITGKSLEHIFIPFK